VRSPFNVTALQRTTALALLAVGAVLTVPRFLALSTSVACVALAPLFAWISTTT
jgi:hypothetical protein